MLSVTQLANQFSVSRATVLYYEKKGLLFPATRSDNGYRWYGDKEIETFGNILSYRSFGLPVSQLKELIERKDNFARERILRKQFCSLDEEIKSLQRQKKAIVLLLKQPIILEKNMVTKDRWVEIMRAAGLNDEDMLNWHRKFESMEPEEHQKFLESLGIDSNEISQIRQL